MFNITSGTVAATRIWVILAILGSYSLASLLHGALNTHSLHMFIRRDLGIDVMTLKNQSQRHRQHEKTNHSDRYQHHKQNCTHKR